MIQNKTLKTSNFLPLYIYMIGEKHVILEKDTHPWWLCVNILQMCGCRHGVVITTSFSRAPESSVSVSLKNFQKSIRVFFLCYLVGVS